MEDDEPAYQSHTAFAARFFVQWHHYKRLLLGYWWIILATVALGGGIELFLLKQAPPAFASVGSMIVNVKLAIPDVNVYSEELNNFFGTQVALMQSDSVVNRVKSQLQSVHPELHSVPVKIEVALLSKTSIFNLRAVGADADYAQAYLRVTMDEYIRLKRDLLANATAATQSGMEEELKQMAVELQKSKEDLLNYQSSNSVVFLQANGGNSAADYLSQMARQLAEHKSELLLLQTLTLDQNLERQEGLFVGQSSGSQSNTVPQQSSIPANSGAVPANDNEFQNNMPPTLGEFEDAYLKAKQELILLTARRDISNQVLASNGYDMTELNQQIAHQESLLQVYKEQSEEQLLDREHTLTVQIQDLQGQIREWELKAVDVSKKLSGFEALKEHKQQLQTRYDQMQANVQTLEANKGIGQESVVILEPATPATLVTPEIPEHFIMASLIGLVLGAGILLFIDKLDDRIHSFTELEQHFNLPVLGQIPLVKAEDEAAGVTLLQLDDERHELVEAYRSIRSALLCRHQDSQNGKLKSIAIASASPWDGKSTTAANFAITLAQAGASVLLIDADLRRGVLHKYFSLAANPGLAGVLTEQCDWSKAVAQTAIPNLSVLPCGTAPPNSDILFAKGGQFLAKIKAHYDYCLFDTSPALVADDVLSLCPHVDGVVMVVRAGFTSSRLAQAALQQLRSRNINITGLILNAVQPTASDFYYHRYKDYYSQPMTK